MPDILLSLGRITRLEVRHHSTVVRLIARTAAGAMTRVVLTPPERDALVAALIGPEPDDASFAELVEQGYFAAAAADVRWAVGGDDRIQDAVCQVWDTQQKRADAGLPALPPRVLRWVFRRRVRSNHDKFARTGGRHRDLLDPRVRGQSISSGFDPEGADATGFSIEELVLVKQLLASFDDADADHIGRRVAGETFQEIGEATGRSTASVHRTNVRIRRRLHAIA